MTWATAPLWSLVRPAGHKVAPEGLAGNPLLVAHYAIDELAATGAPRLQSPLEISSDKLGVASGDILISRLNPRKGHVFEVGSHDVPAIASTEFAVVRTGFRADQRFVRYALTAETTRRLLDSQIRSATKSHGRVEFEAIWSLAVPVPPLEVQQRIVNYLDTETARIDTLLTKNDHVATLIEERLWAVVEKRVLPSEGKTTRLGTLASSMTDGPFGSNLASKHYVDDGPRVVRLGNVGRAQFLDGDVACITPEHFAELQGHSVIAGDLVVAGLGDNSSDAPAGRACVVPDELGPAIVKADCHRVRLPAECSARYFAWQLSSPGSLAEASALARGSTRSRLNLTLNGQRTVVVPPAGKQQQIAADLERLQDQTAELLDHLRHQLNLLRERRQALITAAVTGEFEI